MKLLKFHSVLVPKLWGGTAIAALKGISDAPARVGESFELSALTGQETYCSTAGYEGLTLSQLIEKYGAELVGSENMKRYGTAFPLLIKFIDASQALSVQVHPDDAMAQRLGMPYGKSEMWYVVRTQPEASLIAGFSEDVSPADYATLLADGTLMDKTNRYATRHGDAFYIPAGTLHSIGAGNLIVEVQQSSGATYRVYDFDRKDERGRKRELHVELARQALDFRRRTDCYRHVEEEPFKLLPVVQSPYFTTKVLRLEATQYAEQEAVYDLALQLLDSFVALICYEGFATLTDNEGNQTTLSQGETLLIPAATQSLRLSTQTTFASLMAYV